MIALQAQTGHSETLRLMDLPEMWVVVLVLVPLLALVCWLGYAKETVRPGVRALLASLRFAALSLLLIVLFRPVLVQRREEVRAPEVVILLDDSASMRRKDAYTGGGDAPQKLAPLASGPLRDATRLELASRAVERQLLPQLAERGYGARLFAFADGIAPAAEPGELTGRGAATHVGDALQQALAAHRGRHVTDVVVVSDGRSNGGTAAVEAARAAAAAGVPVHSVVVGDTRPEKNAVVQLVEAPANALEGDEVAVSVRVLGRGLAGSGTVPVQLEELSGPAGSRDEGRVVAVEEVELSEGGRRVLLVAPPGPPDPRTGERRFRVSLPPLSEETLLDDNQLDLAVHVTPEKVRVLYVEGYPRWDYRQLALNVLKRSDENIEFQAFLLSATPDFVQESSSDLPPLTEVPTQREELLERYDVVILGDVNPYSISPDPARCEEFLASLREFVERGGGVLFQAGEYDDPRAFLGTTLEDLLPVLLDPSSTLGYAGDTRREVRPVLEDPANPHEVVRLHPDAEVNRRLWEEDLRGFYWYYPVYRAKPASQVLLRHPTDQNQSGRYPILTTGYFPSGRTMFLAMDATWRWRYRYENLYLERFWRNAIRWLALGRLKSGDRRYRLETPRTSYDLGERVPLEARVLDEDFRPSETPFQSVRWQTPEGAATEEKLPAVSERTGLYRGSLAPERPGLYRVWIEVEGQRIASAEFEVVLPSRENADPSPDPGLMRELAVLSGGRALALADLADLVVEFPGGEERREPISTQLDDVWDGWPTLLLALALLSAEWVLRKRVELV